MYTVAHLTDFSEAGVEAFNHALALALLDKSRFYIVHVKSPQEEEAWDEFPHVRDTLAAWGRLPADAQPADVESKLGIEVVKVEISSLDVAHGVQTFLLSHRPDVVVLATHGREGFDRLLKGSKAQAIADATHIPTIFFGPQARGFANPGTGALNLRRILVPVAHDPAPGRALMLLRNLTTQLRISPVVEFCHVGDIAPGIKDHPQSGPVAVELLDGPVEETILRIANDRQVDMLAMPTAGHHGILDALRGSTTERVIAHAPCPVLALPA